MNEKELDEYQSKLMKGAKGTIGIGVVTGLGSYAFGRMGSNHPEVAPTANAVTGALNLAAIGNMAAVGMSIVPGQEKSKQKSAKKKTPMEDPASYF